MKFVFAPDSFKGTLSSEQQIGILKQKAQEIFPEAETVGVPIADGGEGTMRAIWNTAGGKLKKCRVTGPLGAAVEAEYLILDEDRVFIEMAQASGITLIPYKSGNAGKTTSYGTGELIRNALEAGYRKITVSIGGSATNDGGAGMLAALGVEFYSKDGERFIPVGETLGNIEKIDCSGILSEMRNASFCVMCDVTNPLLGIQGATYVFGPQKGASDRDLEILERGMVHYAEKIEVLCGRKVSEIPGAGAAGGMGAALLAFCNARLQSGIQTVLEMVDFETFAKSDYRAVKIKDCVAVPKSKKLLQFTLDDGSGTDRTILSGIREYYEPEQLIGKTAIAIVNLPPRKMMGIDSCGMLISAVHEEDGHEGLNLLMVDDRIPAGAKLY